MEEDHERQTALPHPGGRPILNISRSKIYELLKSGQLLSVHIDRTRLVRHEDLMAYVDSLGLAG